jgi:peroxiredoxin
MKNCIRIFCFTVFLTSCFATAGFSQAYHIETTIKGVRDSTFIIGHYNRNRSQFIPKDTARADANGRMVFEGNTDLPGGLYVILFPGNGRWVELVYSGKEKRFSMFTDTLDIIGHMQVQNSRENELFYLYQNEIIKKEKEITELTKIKSDASAAKIKADQEEFKLFRQKFFKDNDDTFTIQLFKMSSEPEIPAAPKLANGKTDSTWVFNYYKSHYWDSFNFSDPRILKTPFFEPKLDRYIKNLVVQTPDSLIKDADLIIGKASANPEVKSFVVYYLASQYETPKTVGTEDLWVHIAEKYYLGGDMDISEDVKKRVAEKVSTLKYLLVNKTFPALSLTDPTGKKVSPQTLSANYTVLFFYAPTCGHCKEASPVLKTFYDKNKASGVKVMAISTEHNQDEWKAFITKYNLGEMVNGFDSLHQIDFIKKFDVVTTPTVYVLDKNKKIIARKMPVEQLDDFLNYYKNRMEKKM